VGKDLAEATAPHILVFEDDEELCELISRFLSSHGFEISLQHSGANAASLVLEQQPDLVVLDVMLPVKDGLTICREIRDDYDGPILMLTALGDEVDEVVGLESGADDYLAKPVRPRLLLARIRALLRRKDHRAENVNSSDDSTVNLGDLVISAEMRSVSLDGEDIDLTTAEFDLLWLLASNSGRVLSRDEIHEQLRGIEYDGLDRTIDLRISRLRRKIGDDPRRPVRIKSIRGRGYLMV